MLAARQTYMCGDNSFDELKYVFIFHASSGSLKMSSTYAAENESRSCVTECIKAFILIIVFVTKFTEI
jgi:hypothetical protein